MLHVPSDIAWNNKQVVTINYKKLGYPFFELESQCDGLCNPWVDIPEIKITFQDGVEDRAVFTEHYNPFNTTRSCNYLGHLKKEKDTSTIAITGCADKENVDGRMYFRCHL